MSRGQRIILQALMLVGLLAATYVALGRIANEQANRRVGLAVDYAEVEELAASTAATPTKVLKRLREAGATHLALGEDSLQTLMSRGQAAMYARGETVEIWFSSAERLRDAAKALGNKLPGEYGRAETDEGDNWLVAPALATSVPNVGLGYSPEAVTAARELGLDVVARPQWHGIRTARGLTTAIEQAGAAHAEIMVFVGDHVIGHPDLIGRTAEALVENKVAFGLIELAPQKGEGELSTRLDHRVIRVHSITDAEMRTVSPRRAIERFLRAARERKARLLYLRLLPGAELDPVEANVAYVSAVRDGLKACGLAAGAPRPFARFRTAPWLLALVLLGAWSAALWLIQALLALAPRHFWALTLAVLIGGSAGAVVATSLTRTMGALLAAVVFPTIAVVYAAKSPASGLPRSPRLARVLGLLVGAFLKVSVVTALGGLLIVGALGDSSYLMQVAQFRGVKLAQVLPLAAIALVWLARSTAAYRDRTSDVGPDLVDYHNGVTRAEWPALWAGLRQAFNALVAYWHVAAALAGMVLVVLLLVRSGNEAAGAVLPGELQFRALLDKLLVVRPRTKEVLLGHPVMILTLLLALRGVRRGLWIGFALGSVGQISLMNSFCHTHTPLLLTFVRVFNGLWVGALAGIALCIIWDLLGGRPAQDVPEFPPRDDSEDDG